VTERSRWALGGVLIVNSNAMRDTDPTTAQVRLFSSAPVEDLVDIPRPWVESRVP
jgi:hypothetical protein